MIYLNSCRTLSGAINVVKTIGKGHETGHCQRQKPLQSAVLDRERVNNERGSS